MLKCNECGHVFVRAKLVRGEESDGVFENLAVCPNCESEEIYGAVKCECCGNWKDANEMCEDLQDYCADCVRDALKRMDRLMPDALCSDIFDNMKDNFCI